MGDPTVNDYRRARERDDALVLDKKCEHGGRIRSCGYPSCIAKRARILRRATERGER